MKLSSRETALISIFVGFVLVIALLFTFFFVIGFIYSNKYSEYNNKTYIVKSSNGKISGTIKTTVTACGEGSRCVHANYNLVLNDSITPNKKDKNAKGTYFNENYYYAANIYNTSLDPKKYVYDSKLEPIGDALPAGKFEIKFTKILYNDYYEPDDFLRFTHMDIYDVSNPVYLDKFGFVDNMAPIKTTDNIKSYDFTVSEQK